MNIQKTIVLTYNGNKVVSKPFTFGIAVLIDDEQKRYFRRASREIKEEEISENDIIDALPENEINLKALKKMFEGTIITDEIIENEIDYAELRNALKKIQEMYYQIDEEVKN